MYICVWCQLLSLLFSQQKAAHTSHFFSCTLIRAIFQCCQRLNDEAYANEKMLIVTKKGEETPLKIFLSGNEASGYFLIQKDILEMSQNKLSLETWLQKQEIEGEGVTVFKSPEKSISCSFF